MAYTSIIPVRRLDNALRYVMDEQKTSQRVLVGALGCTVETALEDMRRVKAMWHKETGVQGFHLIQSFAPGEATPELAHRIGLELSQELLHGEFQVVVSTHLDRKHLHNHLVWNSVSLCSGRKYRSNPQSYQREIRACSDRLCEKYGLSVIRTEQSKGVSYAQWMAEQAGKSTWKTRVQKDIDEVAAMVFTWKQFLFKMEEKGYTFRWNRTYPTILPPGKQRPVRLKTLGKSYTPEAIQRRILAPKRTVPMARTALQSQKIRMYGIGKPSRNITGLRALYFSYLYKMGALRRKPRYPCYAVREDIRKLDRRIEQMHFLSANRIDNREQLDSLRMEKERGQAALWKQRQALYRHAPDSPQIQPLTDQLRELRRVVKLCREIARQSVEMEQRMQAAKLEEKRWREQKSKQNHREKERIL